jgi:aerobic carbon-monoxide dehydrogenase small subunit
MKQLRFTVNGKSVAATVEPRTHLADFLREKIRLTGTHLRCEQGVCGACTVLIDGQPARSCITYAALCEEALVTTIEGLENDPITVMLRRAFSLEHGLQCGFCTPGMLVTARDIVMRFPQADEARIRVELSGNLCRCTGYAGIVRAIQRVLVEMAAIKRSSAIERELPLAPVGARLAKEKESSGHNIPTPRPVAQRNEPVSTVTTFGLGPKKPNIQIKQSFRVDRPREEVWRFFADVEGMASCLPGARLNGPPVDNHVQGQFSAKLGPIAASFYGEAKIERIDDSYRGIILGGGQDARAGSRAAGELKYRLVAIESDAATQVDLEIRALIAGPLAQFGRSGIVDDLTRRIIDTFAKNLETKLSGRGHQAEFQTSFQAGSLLKDVMVARLKSLMEPVLRIFKSRQ